MEYENLNPEPQPSVNDLQETGAEAVSDVDVALKDNVAAPTPSQTTPGPYRHFLGFAIGCAVVCFLCALGLGESVAPFFPLAACVYSTVFLVALWSVFGPGNYLIRMFGAHAFGAIPVVALTIGVCIRSIGQWNAISELGYAVTIGIISIVPISLSAQLPCWIFRSLFGWQLVFRDDSPERSFSLRDVFVLTFVFALCFAIPQASANLGSAMFGSNVYDNTQRAHAMISEDVLQSDGTYVSVERVLTAAEMSELRRRAQRDDQMNSYAIYGICAISVIVISLLSTPVVLVTFRTKEAVTGCGFAGLYVFGIWSVMMAIAAIAFGVAPPEVFLYFGVLLALCGGAVAVPLSVARETGFRLTSPKRFAREHPGG